MANEIKVNADQFCPVCYGKSGVMRNVYAKLGDLNGELYCPIHGLVMHEDVHLRKYSKMDYAEYLKSVDVEDTIAPPVEPTDGKSLVGEAKVGEDKVD